VLYGMISFLKEAGEKLFGKTPEVRRGELPSHE
jgi:hypothetical protein